MFTYLIINILIVIFPLMLSFDTKLRFIRNLKHVVIASLISNVFLISWDILATYLGHWSFNSSYITGLTIINLPIEEVLFFFTAPYSLVFIYEVIRHYSKDKRYALKEVFNLISVFLLILSIMLSENQYTSFAFLFLWFILFTLNNIYPSVIHSRSFLITVLIAIIPFVIINYLLTSIPVVEYSSTAITGIRVLTIPIEDFIFNTVMVILYVQSYVWVKRIVA